MNSRDQRRARRRAGRRSPRASTVDDGIKLADSKRDSIHTSTYLRGCLNAWPVSAVVTGGQQQATRSPPDGTADPVIDEF